MSDTTTATATCTQCGTHGDPTEHLLDLEDALTAQAHEIAAVEDPDVHAEMLYYLGISHNDYLAHRPTAPLGWAELAKILSVRP